MKLYLAIEKKSNISNSSFEVFFYINKKFQDSLQSDVAIIRALNICFIPAADASPQRAGQVLDAVNEFIQNSSPQLKHNSHSWIKVHIIGNVQNWSFHSVLDTPFQNVTTYYRKSQDDRLNREKERIWTAAARIILHKTTNSFPRIWREEMVSE